MTTDARQQSPAREEIGTSADRQLAFDELLRSQMPDAVIATAADGRVLHWNAGASRIYDYARDDAQGRRFDDLIVPAELVEEERRIAQTARVTGTATHETVRRRRDGALVHVDVSSRWIAAGVQGEGFLLRVEKDVTQLKALRDATLLAARFRDLLESMPDAIVIVNAAGRIVLTNGPAAALFGYPSAALTGQPVELLLPERLRSAHAGYRGAYFTQPRVRAMGAGQELHGRRADGSEFPVQISLSPLVLDEGVLAVSAIRDATEHKKAERELQEKNAELAAANRAKDMFLASMSHELRTPLNAIIGFTGTLLMRLPGPLNDDQEKQLRTVQRGARHLLALINDLLDLAKIEAGKVDLAADPVDCGEVVVEILGSLRPQADRKGLDLTVTLPEAGPVIVTDRRIVSQIVLNLVGNAIKFTTAGGVSVAVALRREAGGDWLTIRVSDTGIGIAANDLPVLFNAFARLDGLRRTQEGTGLGLHLSRKLAELLGGRITVESEVGAGSRFTLDLPGA
jgi:PAS domain S-box-containing protein